MSSCHKAIALIGSSGGGTATLGHTDPVTFLTTIHNELMEATDANGRTGIMHLAAALYVSCDVSLDHATPSVHQATLYEGVYNRSSRLLQVKAIHSGALVSVNQVCRERQRLLLVTPFQRRQLDGLICVSCHVGIFYDTLTAAALRGSPVTGSGGTSLSQAAMLANVVLVGNAGGSVATTTYTRAVSYTHAFASHFGLQYSPWRKGTEHDPSWTSLCNACWPAVWSVSMVTQGLQHVVQPILVSSSAEWQFPSRNVLENLDFALDALRHQAVASLACIVVATSLGRHTSDSASTARASAAAMASLGCRNGGLLSGILAGFCVSRLQPRLVYGPCLTADVPATMTSLLSIGGVGSVVALTLLCLVPWIQMIADALRGIIRYTVSWHRIERRAAAGFLWGCACCYGSRAGHYHAVMLPCILLEMESGEPSFLGAVDELTLVLVCAGICSGAVVLDWMNHLNAFSDSNRSLCRRALRTNLLFGDFVEACYPFMDKSSAVIIGGYLASGISCAWLIASGPAGEIPLSSAYVPMPMAVALAGSQWRRFLQSAVLSYSVSFVSTIVAGFTHGLRSNG